MGKFNYILKNYKKNRMIQKRCIAHNKLSREKLHSVRLFRGIEADGCALQLPEMLA